MQSVRVEWLTGTYPILLYQFDTDFTIDDYLTAVTEAWRLIDAHPTEIFYIAADVSNVRRIPTQLITTMFKEYGKSGPPFAGLTILIGAPRFIQQLVGQFQNLFLNTSKFTFADTLNDLDSVIKQHVQDH